MAGGILIGDKVVTAANVAQNSLPYGKLHVIANCLNLYDFPQYCLGARADITEVYRAKIQEVTDWATDFGAHTDLAVMQLVNPLPITSTVQIPTQSVGISPYYEFYGHGCIERGDGPNGSLKRAIVEMNPSVLYDGERSYSRPSDPNIAGAGIGCTWDQGGPLIFYVNMIRYFGGAVARIHPGVHMDAEDPIQQRYWLQTCVNNLVECPGVFLYPGEPLPTPLPTLTPTPTPLLYPTRTPRPTPTPSPVPTCAVGFYVTPDRHPTGAKIFLPVVQQGLCR